MARVRKARKAGYAMKWSIIARHTRRAELTLATLTLSSFQILVSISNSNPQDMMVMSMSLGSLGFPRFRELVNVNVHDVAS
jgi:hypothetical protein